MWHQRWCLHDGIMTWKIILHNWPFARWIRQFPSQRASNKERWCSFDVSRRTLLKNQSSSRWIRMLCCSFDVMVMCILFPKLILVLPSVGLILISVLQKGFYTVWCRFTSNSPLKWILGISTPPIAYPIRFHYTCSTLNMIMFYFGHDIAQFMMQQMHSIM